MFFFATLFMTLCQTQSNQPQLQQELTVTASMVPVEFSNCARSVTVLNQDDIQASGASSLQELIQLVGVQVRERGAIGVQADVAMRGASFEQTLVLIDGVKMLDPQTGHHLLNLPVNLNQIERIEVLRGPGSRVYGPNAFGGVINLITRKKPENTSINLDFGEHGYRSEALQGGHAKGDFLLRYSLKHRTSDGYIENTDFDQHTLNVSMDLQKGDHAYQLMLGEDQKDFGANRFYHPDFPNQREETRARLAKLNGSWILGSFNMQANLSHRIHNDDFLLDYQRPDWYRNVHETKVTGLDLKSSRANRAGLFSFGAEWITENIDSSNLGDHQREKTGLFIEQQLNFANWDVVLGSSAYEFSDHGWEWWPGVDVAWRPNQNNKFFATVGRSFRLPTFTELFYNGGGNVGNPDLDAEQAWNSELGYNFNATGIQLQAALFHRNADNMIDWVWDDQTRLYYATNFTEMDTTGLELELIKSFSSHGAFYVEQVRLFYTLLDSELNTSGLTTKYLIGHPDHNASLMLRLRLGSYVRQSLNLRHEEGDMLDPRTFLDLNTQISFGKTTMVVTVDNATNTHVQDFNRVELPGRWVRFSLRYEFK